MEALSTADRIAAALGEQNSVVSQNTNTELPNSDMNLPPHLVAKATTNTVVNTAPVAASVVPTIVQDEIVDPTIPDTLTLEELIEIGIPMEAAKLLTPENLEEIRKKMKNLKVRKWSKCRIRKAKSVVAHGDAVKAAEVIQHDQMTTPIHSVAAASAIVSKSDKPVKTMVKTMTAKDVEARIGGIEKSISDLTKLVKLTMVADQKTQQVFTPVAAPAAVAPIAAPVMAVRVFPYTQKKGGLGANIAIEPLPATVTQWHNSALFTPGQIKNVYAMFTKDPAAFAQNIEAAYRESLPYQYKKEG